MDTPSVTICFSAGDDAPSLTACLEQLLSHLNLEPPEPDKPSRRAAAPPLRQSG